MLILLFAVTSGPMPAAAEVDLRLVLAVDASGSVNAARFALQRHGYAEAFRDPRVLRAIGLGANQAISVALFQWTGPALQVDVIGWTELRSAADAAALADRIEAGPRRLFGGGTSISGAIDHAMGLFADQDDGARRVIDVSGDGANTSGRAASAARDAAVARGVVINGLPILTVEPDLAAHYRNEVIGGAGSFLIAIDSYDRFAEAIVRKLVTEIAGRAAEARPFAIMIP